MIPLSRGSWKLAKHCKYSPVALSCFYSPLPPLLLPLVLLSTSHTHHKKLVAGEHQRQPLRLGWGFKATLGKQRDTLITKALSSDTHIQFTHQMNQRKTRLDLPVPVRWSMENTEKHRQMGSTALSVTTEKGQSWGSLDDIGISSCLLPHMY